MHEYLFSIFPNEKFIDLDYTSTDGNAVHRPISSVRLPEPTIYFIMSSPEPDF